ncbi:neurogenic locus protein delta-like isoform X2 [Portunus trituberculatus]|uniref:neurogenic locus protein delta-like isoform X2 n=1 Tax=Portunus trituberculatus TaxID=210409 RepID=UPI001E1CBB67|nr:neurogenic locus protein delta-like isoform X2 [Portunus trituberculatus]
MLLFCRDVPVCLSSCLKWCQGPNAIYYQEAAELAVGYRCSCRHSMGGLQCSIVTVVVGSVARPSPEAEAMSAGQVVLVVVFSTAMPVLVVELVLVIMCMNRKRVRDCPCRDEEARGQNEQNMVHNAVGAVNSVWITT